MEIRKRPENEYPGANMRSPNPEKQSRANSPHLALVLKMDLNTSAPFLHYVLFYHMVDGMSSGLCYFPTYKR